MKKYLFSFLLLFAAVIAVAQPVARVKDLFAGIRDIVGGRAGAYEKVLSEAKDTSMLEMMQRAQAMGANAIVGIDIDYETVGANGSMLMVATSGTAVVI